MRAKATQVFIILCKFSYFFIWRSHSVVFFYWCKSKKYLSIIQKETSFSQQRQRDMTSTQMWLH